MTYKLAIELSARDLRHFRRELRKARAAVRIAGDDEIVSAAQELVASLRHSRLPDFIRQRLDKLESMIAMVTDPDWVMSDAERRPVLAALVYLCDPDDLIPDNVPGIGLLDDAVMIELVFSELQHEIEAYEDYVAYRKSLLRRRTGGARTLADATRLERRRIQLVARMNRRLAKASRGSP